MIRDLIIKNRSYRRFDESIKIEAPTIRKWVELARFSASGRNAQPMKYIVCTSEETVSKIFQNLGWAGYLPGWDGPAEGERPVAYIAVIHDKNIAPKYYCDDGIAMQSILLGAVADGYGGCILGSINREEIQKITNLPENMEILWMVALGKPIEKVVLEDLTGGGTKYWRDVDDVHHVPKRLTNELILKEI